MGSPLEQLDPQPCRRMRFVEARVLEPRDAPAAFELALGDTVNGQRDLVEEVDVRTRMRMLLDHRSDRSAEQQCHLRRHRRFRSGDLGCECIG